MFQLFTNLPESILSSITESFLLPKASEVNFFEKLTLNIFHSPVKNNLLDYELN